MSDIKKTGMDLAKYVNDPTMLFSVMIITIVLMLIIPVPAFMLDFLMSLSILSGLIIVLTVAYVEKAVDFAAFPAVLLVTTIFRLAINVSSTRLILSKGAEFDGQMVRAFGSFVVGSTDLGGLVIGVIVFTILVIVQFLVITKGATRVSEVAARFSLDGMQNKYMSIEMDQNNGLIDEHEAIKRRREVEMESAFYGNMDGASKFVQGDVIVGIIITIINIVGGFAVGMGVRGEPFDMALNNYIQLTIGDGLVSQIPSLLISFSTGLIVTRSQSKDSIGKDIWKQLVRQYKIFYIASGTLAVLAILPGFPHVILALLSGGMALSGYFISQGLQKASKAKEDKKEESHDEKKGPEDVTDLLDIDPLTLHIGYELIPFVDKSQNAELLNAISGLRRNMALEMGIELPPIRIQDNIRLMPNEYIFKIRGQEIGQGIIKTGCMMAMGDGLEPVEGEKTVEPAFGLTAYWIKNDLRSKAEGLGYTVVDAPTIISTHIQELLRQHAYEILDREGVKKLLDNAERRYPTLVNDVRNVSNFTNTQVQKVLQNLLIEGVSVRDIVTILETMSEHSSQTPIFNIIEFVRQALKRAICSRYVTDDKKLHVIRINPKIENEIFKNLSTESDGEPVLRLNPNVLNKIQMLIKDEVTKMFQDGLAPVILTQPPIRRAIWELCQYIHNNIAVISTRELVNDVELMLYSQVEVVETAGAV